jgi:hypothetical protein
VLGSVFFGAPIARAQPNRTAIYFIHLILQSPEYYRDLFCKSTVVKIVANYYNSLHKLTTTVYITFHNPQENFRMNRMIYRFDPTSDE